MALWSAGLKVDCSVAHLVDKMVVLWAESMVGWLVAQLVAM